MADLTLYYHPFASYCWKVLIALYESGADFSPREIDLGAQPDRAALETVWPMRKFPVLVDATRGVTLPESSVIIEYLDRYYPSDFKAIPQDDDTMIEVRLMDRLFDGFIMTPMQTVVASHIRQTGRDLPGEADARAALATAYDVIDARLAGRDWAAGDNFTLADCAAFPSLHYADRIAAFRETHPTLAAYMARLEARPSVRRVLDGAAPYAHFFPVPPAG